MHMHSTKASLYLQFQQCTMGYLSLYSHITYPACWGLGYDRYNIGNFSISVAYHRYSKNCNTILRLAYTYGLWRALDF